MPREPKDQMEKLERAGREIRTYIGGVNRDLSEKLGKIERSLGDIERISKEALNLSEKIEAKLAPLEKSTSGNTFWINGIRIAGGAMGTVLLGWLVFLSREIYSMHGDIQALKQAESANGTAIVSRLEKPASIDQLKHDLQVTDAKLQLQRLNVSPKTRIEPTSLNGLNFALLTVTETHPNLSEGWKAAAQFVSYKSEVVNSAHGSLPSCDVTHMKVEHRQTPLANGGLAIDSGYFFEGCVLTLEDIPPQHQVGQFQFPIIFLSNGVVVYRGGPVDKSNDTYVFTNCRFDITPRGLPPKPVQQFLDAALKQNELLRVEVNTPPNAPS